MELYYKPARCKSIYIIVAISRKTSDTKEMKSQGSMLGRA